MPCHVNTLGLFFMFMIACKDTVAAQNVNYFAQVSIHVAATHQTSEHQTLKSQIQMVGPYASFCVGG